MKKCGVIFLLFLALPSMFAASCAPESAPTSSPAAVLTWQDAYAEFLREYIPATEVNFDTFDEGSEEQIRYGAFLAGGYPVYPFFYLYDMDKDGIPELILIDVTSVFDGDVYAYKDGSIFRAGGIAFYTFGGLGIPLDESEGLYSDIGYKGHYGEIYFYALDDGVLTGEMVLEYNKEHSPYHRGWPDDFEGFTWIDYCEVTEANIIEVIYGGV